MTSQRISLSGSPSFAGTRSISADGDLYGLVSNEILILSSADGVLYETSFKRHNARDDPVAANKLNTKIDVKCDLGPSHCYHAVSPWQSVIL